MFLNAKSMFSLFKGRHDIQHNDTQHNGIQHNDTQHNGIQHNDTQHKDTQHNDNQHNGIHHNDTQHNKSKIATLSIMTLSIMAHRVLFMLNAIYAECHK
jgi:hypothetical protein